MGALSLTSNARFDNATLDAALPNLLAYYDFSETDFNFRNKAPNPRIGKLFPVGGVTVSSAGPDGKGVDFDATTDYLQSSPGQLPICPGAEFSINFWHAPDDATPAAERVIAGVNEGSASSNGIGIDITTGARLLLFAAGATRITGATGTFSDATNAMVTLRRYLNAGTPTWEIYLNGTSEGTATTSADTLSILSTWFLHVGRYAATANNSPGVTSALSVWDKALSTAETAALYNSGAGRFLLGV